MSDIAPINTTKLVDRLKQKDRIAFSELYDSYSSALYGIIYRIVKSEPTAKDALQEAFVKIWKNIHSYDSSKASFFTWMLNIARNTAIDKLRKNKIISKSEIRDSDNYVSVENQYQTGIKVNHIGMKELVEKLDPQQKILIDYIYFDGYTQQETADELGIPLGTVKTRVRTALKELRKVFSIILFWI